MVYLILCLQLYEIHVSLSDNLKRQLETINQQFYMSILKSMSEKMELI